MKGKPNIIDIEASGFGVDSYPIEVGVITTEGDKYCTLIQPEPDWVFWDDKAEVLHKIGRPLLLKRGKPVREVANELNHILAGQTLYSDGWVVDHPWLIKLYAAAGLSPSFTLSALEMILREKQMERWHYIKGVVTEELKLQRHRASADAEIIQETYFRTLAQSE